MNSAVSSLLFVLVVIVATCVAFVVCRFFSKHKEGLEAAAVADVPTSAVAPTTSSSASSASSSSAPTSSAAPTTSSPTSSAPTSSTPTTSSPTSSAPTTSASMSSAPTTSAPTTSAPTTSAPTTSAPTTSSPTSSAPTTSSPTSSAPTTSSPTSSAPTTSAPTTSAPTTSAPTTSAPTTSAPTTSAPTTSAPTTSAPTFSSPTTSTPASATDFAKQIALNELTLHPADSTSVTKFWNLREEVRDTRQAQQKENETMQQSIQDIAAVVESQDATISRLKSDLAGLKSTATELQNKTAAFKYNPESGLTVFSGDVSFQRPINGDGKSFFFPYLRGGGLYYADGSNNDTKNTRIVNRMIGR